MCLILFAHQVHPDYPLVVIANRDEFYKRPTTQADWWESDPNLLAGRDLVAGGSWLAVGRNGRFSGLTNYRDPNNILPDAPTRGLLVTDFVQGTTSAGAYLDALHSTGQLYNGFNILVGDGDELWHYSNQAGAPAKLAPGIYGVSNAVLDTPWPKVVEGKEKLAHLLQSPQIDVEMAFEALNDPHIAPDEALPDTGVPLEWERKLSALYIEMPTYGTRCSTVVLKQKDGQMTFVERSYVPDRGTARYEWRMEERLQNID